MSFIINMLKGAVIGIANAVPGVSGGTMAVILKIYDKLLNAISLNIKRLKENWKFILSIGIGVVLGVFFAAAILSFLFEKYGVATQLFFMGIVIGSIPMIYNESIKNEKIKPINIMPFISGVGLILLITLINGQNITQPILTELTLPVFIKLFIYLFISAIAMIIPGLSGSFVMLIFGVYQTVIEAVKDMNIEILFPVALGAAAGILGGAKIISIFLKKYHQATYCAILGLVIGSVYGIYPRDFQFNSEGFIGISLLVIGIIIPNIMKIFDKKRKV